MEQAVSDVYQLVLKSKFKTKVKEMIKINTNYENIYWCCIIICSGLVSRSVVWWDYWWFSWCVDIFLSWVIHLAARLDYFFCCCSLQIMNRLLNLTANCYANTIQYVLYIKKRYVNLLFQALKNLYLNFLLIFFYDLIKILFILLLHR